MKKLLPAVLAVMLVVLVLSISRASATNSEQKISPICYVAAKCGFLRHLPDNGYDAPFHVQCDRPDPSTWFHLAEGYTNLSYGCGDLDRIYVRPGEEIRCRRISYKGIVSWYTKWDAAGWHEIHDYEEHYQCVNGVD